ncbi:MAG: hypothetical protein JW866_01400 [Ignavibacteriales bacterium]|nr:hypothetical protein [Ignavibacteriales bacterium]
MADKKGNIFRMPNGTYRGNVIHKAKKLDKTAIKWKNFCFTTHEKRERIADQQSISLASLPSKLCFAAKHMLSLPPRAD